MENQVDQICQIGTWLANHDPDLEKLISSRIKLHNAEQLNKRLVKARDFVDIGDKIKEIQYNNRRTDYWFITVNAAPDVALGRFFQTVSQFCKRFQNCVYVFENTVNNHIHAHIVAYIPNHTRDTAGVYRTHFLRRKIVGNRKAVDIRWLKSMKDVHDTIAYIRKTKKSKSKDKSNEVTKKWRKLNKIENCYSMGDSLLVSLPEGDELAELEPELTLRQKGESDLRSKSPKDNSSSDEDDDDLIPLNY